MVVSARKSIVISVDTELIWGFHDLRNIPWERVRNARESWRLLVELFERHEIPATWAIVGHLFLGECDGSHSSHPAGAEWFDRDPGGAATSDSYWFGRDLIELLLDSDVNHDLGSHSFSHVEFGHSETTAEIANAELRYSQRVAGEYGLEPTSFVFPRNNIGYRNLLADHGFTCYRGPTPNRWYDKTPGRRLGKFVTWGLGASTPPIVTPEIDKYGLVNIPASLYLFGFEGTPRAAVETVTENPAVQQVELGLKQLRNESEGIFHLWLHPNNITTDGNQKRVEKIISKITEYRDRHGITIETMTQVADRARDSLADTSIVHNFTQR